MHVGTFDTEELNIYPIKECLFELLKSCNSKLILNLYFEISI